MYRLSGAALEQPGQASRAGCGSLILCLRCCLRGLVVGRGVGHTRRKIPLNLSSSQGATQRVGKQDGVAIVDRRLEIPIQGTLSLEMIAAVYVDS
jgi:hypothetical protein